MEMYRIDEVLYEVIDDEDRIFTGELDDCLDVYHAWSTGNPIPFEIEWHGWDDDAELDIIIEFEDDGD